MKRFYKEENHSIKYGMGCYEMKQGVRKVNRIWVILYRLGFIDKKKAASKIKNKCTFSMIAAEEARPTQLIDNKPIKYLNK